MRILITGGAGFIGCHATSRFAADHDVTVLDNLERGGAKANLDWLRARRRLTFLQEDVRDAGAVTRAVAGSRPDVVLHLAGQVAVTSSVRDPRHDFEVNALGTFNVLEAARTSAPEALVLYASTNKVYGALEDLEVALVGQRYEFTHLSHGVAEEQPLDFHSPYGCSKGAADQYVRDYARIYGLRTVVFRQSCVYGPRQWGAPDQGWVAWFAACAAQGRPITVFGNGFQVRDLLWVEDLIDAYLTAVDRRDRMTGRVFNIGGGPANQLSLRECVGRLETLLGRTLPLTFAPPRPGDQRVFVADIRLAERELGWRPRIGPKEGTERLAAWVRDHGALPGN